MRLKGYSIKLMGEDGACLFRAVADQLYGDQVQLSYSQRRHLRFNIFNAFYIIFNIYPAVTGTGEKPSQRYFE